MTALKVRKTRARACTHTHAQTHKYTDLDYSEGKKNARARAHTQTQTHKYTDLDYTEGERKSENQWGKMGKWSLTFTQAQRKSA